MDRHAATSDLKVALTSVTLAQRNLHSALGRGQWSALQRASAAGALEDLGHALERIVALTDRAEVTPDDQPL